MQDARCVETWAQSVRRDDKALHSACANALGTASSQAPGLHTDRSAAVAGLRSVAV